mmetsp:Transcript_39478/g.84156  ORF Transcript_39478/g.84156 Transcript_39478/m.84156 type:complete len:424 (+) Transcript_39478:679-1950(+)
MMQQPIEAPAKGLEGRFGKQRQKKGSKSRGGRQQQVVQQTQQQSVALGSAGSFSACSTTGIDYQLPFGEMVTSITVSGVPPESCPESFMTQLDSWGLGGTYDFFIMPTDKQTGVNCGYALINFIDPAFVLLFCWIYQGCQFQGTVAPAEVQGCEANSAYWSTAEDFDSQPVVLINPVPSQWSVNTVNTMLSPQFREQFRKTKLCVFHKKNRCELGSDCPFAHSQDELQPAPDLAKTKLCYNFFRGRCTEPRCKFAHGSMELRSVWVPYSPGIWFFGGAKEDDDDFQGLPAGAVLGYPGVEDMQGYLTSPLMMQMQEGMMQDGSSVDGERSESASAATFTGSFSRSISDQFLGSAPMAQADEKMMRATTTPIPVFQEGVALRVRGTFMEAMKIRDEEPLALSRQRSWSDGDLPAFRDAMDDLDL